MPDSRPGRPNSTRSRLLGIRLREGVWPIWGMPKVRLQTTVQRRSWANTNRARPLAIRRSVDVGRCEHGECQAGNEHGDTKPDACAVRADQRVETPDNEPENNASHEQHGARGASVAHVQRWPWSLSPWEVRPWLPDVSARGCHEVRLFFDEPRST